MPGDLSVIALALMLRAAIFPLAENKFGDAPSRSLIAERMNLEPGLGRRPSEYRQFGPLHLAAMRPFLALDADVARGSRWLSLAAGVAVLVPLMALTRRMFGRPAARLAGLALALSPLHLQLSTTAASEALYVLLLVACLERLAAGRMALAGLLGGLAAVTRYDAWIALPAAFAVLLGAQRKLSRELAVLVGSAALPPLAWVIWSASVSGDAVAPIRLISSTHGAEAAAVAERLGPFLAGLRQIEIWTLGLASAMTPLPLAALLLRRGRLPSPVGPADPVARAVLAAALAPPLVYLARGLALGAFEPLARFAAAPGVLLLPFAAQRMAAAARSQRAAAWVLAMVATAFSVAALALAFGAPGRARAGAEALGPVTRLDAEDRALAGYLRAHRRPGEPVYLDPFVFADLIVTCAARIPARESLSLVVSREPARALAAVGRGEAAWLAVHDASWGPLASAACPGPTEARFGGWRLYRVRTACTED